VTLFDAYIMVDWSAANKPKQGKDSIWFSLLQRHSSGLLERALENPPTRHAAFLRLREMLREQACESRAALVGFDFPLGYARGFAAALRLDGPAWRAVWDELGNLLTDDESNDSNRFAVADDLNRRISGRGFFPFWGRPAGQVRQFLGATRLHKHVDGGITERRLVELRATGAQTAWKLLGVGSVGSQALTGIPVVRRLRDDPEIAPHAEVWPFETGLRRLADDGRRPRFVFAEIYPSLIKHVSENGEVKDSAQVRSLARYFAALDSRGELAELFAGDPRLGDAERIAVEQEEGWVLGVRGMAEGRHAAPNVSSPLEGEDGRGHGPRSGGGSAQRAREISSRRRRPPPIDAAASPTSPSRGEENSNARVRIYNYLRDPAAIYRRSFELIRRAVDLSPFPPELHALALRLVHAVADPTILADLRWSSGAVAAGRAALASGAPILADAAMAAHGVNRSLLPQANEVICTLADPSVAARAAAVGTTRSAAAVELWRPHLAGAVVAIGNAPTALFHLLELIASGAPRPALILGFPVGFVGAAEAKAALVENTLGLNYVALAGRRGGSAMAAAAVNALASEEAGG
jgi:precorrin-8X/cobalt-precorrin-8 methylmutase